MNDKEMMEDILNSTKGVCDLYLHGTIESGTKNVGRAFKNALSDALHMKEEIYQKMSDKGWYKTETAQPQQIQSVASTYASGVK